MKDLTSAQSLIFKTFCLIAVLLGLTDGDVISKFFANYDKALRPDFELDRPTIVECSLYVESFGNIEEANMEYKVYTYFRQYWNDSRLAGKLNRTLLLAGSDIGRMWVPDPYCYNARESNMMNPDEGTHSILKIKPNGEISYSRGVTLLASCDMDLHHFPLDSQECILKFGSYGHSTVDIIFKWVPGDTEVSVGNKELAQFEYKGSTLTSGAEEFAAAGIFSTMTATFLFHRRIGYYLIQAYFPSIFVVVLSWIVFWMDKEGIGDRITLGITAVLTTMFLLASLNGNLPKVSYPKALDWYLLASFSFVFLTLIECTIVFLFASSGKQDEEHIAYKNSGSPLATRKFSFNKTAKPKGDSRRVQHAEQGGISITGCDDLEMVYRGIKADKAGEDNALVNNNNRSIKNKRYVKIADNIDRASRVLFPLAFTIYNIFYWSYY